MAIFRADHYLIAEFQEIPDVRETGQNVLEALQQVSELKDLAMVYKRMEGKQWTEILGRIDIPEGSKAFWAMVKKDITEREPYNLFVRLDRNAEGETIEDARALVKKWVESNIIPHIESKTNVKSIKAVEPQEIYMPDLD